jgi:hypothetical protein
VRQFQTDDIALSLSLDGAAIAIERDRRIALVSTDPAESTGPIDLGPIGRTLHFTQT